MLIGADSFSCGVDFARLMTLFGPGLGGIVFGLPLKVPLPEAAREALSGEKVADRAVAVTTVVCGGATEGERLII